jgi:hypothetical protein
VRENGASADIRREPSAFNFVSVSELGERRTMRRGGQLQLAKYKAASAENGVSLKGSETQQQRKISALMA